MPIDEETRRRLSGLPMPQSDTNEESKEDNHYPVHISGPVMESGLTPTEEEYKEIIRRFEGEQSVDPRVDFFIGLEHSQDESMGGKFREINGKFYYIKNNSVDVDDIHSQPEE